VQYDPTSGVLNAAGPKLDADITPVIYKLTVGGKLWTGMIGVPPGGTHDLAETGRLQLFVPSGTVGPHGGEVQRVGPDRVELIANKHTGDVRAYVLDSENQPVDPGDREITVAVEGARPSVLTLTPDPQAHFAVGHLPALFDAPHVTVAVHERDTTHAGLLGWSGGVVLVGPGAPRVHLVAVDTWPGEVIEVHRVHGKHVGVIADAPDAVVEGPGVVVGAPGDIVVGRGNRHREDGQGRDD
jgi:hypothetical protein